MFEALTFLKRSFRSLSRQPGLSSIAVIALGLGIGLTAVMFSIVYSALFRGLPYENSDRLMATHRINPEVGITQGNLPLQDFMDLREEQQSFEVLTALFSGTVNVSGTDGVERYQGGFMLPDGFAPIGVEPILGRGFNPDDNEIGAPLVILLGHHIWTSRYGSDPNIVGQSLRVNGETATVIGVMPERFRFPNLEDVWVPMRRDANAEERGAGTFVMVYGQLREGVDADRAVLDLSGIAERLEAEFPETNEGMGVVVRPFIEASIGPEARGILLTMLAGVFLVLFIACANVANLLLARASSQTRDLAVRTAMGANRGRLIAQLLSEAVALALVGALLGLGIAFVGIQTFSNAVASTDPPYWLVFRLDTPVVLFVLVVTFIAAVSSGIFPALQASSTDISGVLKDESRGSSSLRMGRLTKSLVVVQVAFSVGLLIQAGLMVKSVINAKVADYGFAQDNVFTARLGLFLTAYPDTVDRLGFFDEVKTRLEGQPGVESVALTNSLPGTGSGSRAFALEGRSYDRDQDYPVERHTVITPDFFETFEVGVVAGRGFTDQDAHGNQPVTIVNQSFADRYFPDEDPIGRRIRMGQSESTLPWLTIVGVAPDLWMDGLGAGNEPDPEGFYTPLAQEDARFMSIAVLTRGEALAVTPVVRQAVTSVDRDVPLYWVDSMGDVIQDNLWIVNVFGGLFVAFGAAALFMASIGLYGVMSFSVSRRTQEMGIRMALGAGSGEVRHLVLRQGVMQLLVGLFFGLFLAFGLAYLLRTMLFLVEPSDPWTYIGIAGIILGTGLLATFIPARRATRVEPVVALRYE